MEELMESDSYMVEDNHLGEDRLVEGNHLGEDIQQGHIHLGEDIQLVGSPVGDILVEDTLVEDIHVKTVLVEGIHVKSGLVEGSILQHIQQDVKTSLCHRSHDHAYPYHLPYFIQIGICSTKLQTLGC